MKVLIRSSKFLSLLFGTLIFSRNHNVSSWDLFWGILLTLGIVVFQMGNTKKTTQVTVFKGFVFGVLSLVCDSCVSHF